MAWLLGLTLLAFIAGHLLSREAVWDHRTGEFFSPFKNWVSDYAYRSPAWPWFIGCMDAFALILAVLSFKFFGLPGKRSVVPWLMTALLAYGSLKLVEVSVFPVKPPEVTIEDLQQRLDRNAWERLKDDLEDVYRNARGQAAPEQQSAWDVVSVFQSNTGHLIGIRGGLVAVILAMALGMALPLGRPWRVLSILFFAGAVVSIYCSRGEYHGLYQRLAFLSIYAWMWLAVLTLYRPGAGTTK